MVSPLRPHDRIKAYKLIATKVEEMTAATLHGKTEEEQNGKKMDSL